MFALRNRVTMARHIGLHDFLTNYTGAAIQLGATLILQQQNEAKLKANAQERQHDMRRWRTRKSREEHAFFFAGTRRRRHQILCEGLELAALFSNLRKELRETGQTCQNPP